ncbi:unnamed protein product [Cunninghamella blakesleeana]
MDKETITLLIQKYKQYETIFFNTTNLMKWTSIIDIRNSYLYGEIGFCLAGLKPSVLFDFPVELNDQYIHSVVQPWMKQYSHLLDKWQLFPCQLISPEIQSPTPVYFFIRLNDERLINTKLIELMNNSNNDYDSNNNNSSSYQLLHISTEDVLATILDYPGRLPKSYKDLETMREVVYYNDDDDDDDNKKHVLTTFACQLDEQSNVYQHFIHYKNKMEPFGLKLKMIIRQPL